MDAYTSFASVYDTFMDNIPYEEWAEYLITILKEYGVKAKLGILNYILKLEKCQKARIAISVQSRPVSDLLLLLEIFLKSRMNWI